MPRKNGLLSYKDCTHPGPFRAVTVTLDGTSAYGICTACDGGTHLTSEQVRIHESRPKRNEVPREWKPFHRSVYKPKEPPT